MCRGLWARIFGVVCRDGCGDEGQRPEVREDEARERGPGMNQPLFRIVAPHFVAGFEVDANRVWRTAPIIGYMRGWKGVKVKAYCNQRGWILERVNGP